MLKTKSKKLAKFIEENYPEFIVDGGAGDVAIEIIKALPEQVDNFDPKDYRDV